MLCVKRMCGCGLGGVAAGVGIFGSLGTYGWKVGATTTAYETAKQAGIQAGIEAAIAKIKGNPTFESIWTVGWSNIINRSNYNSIPGLVDAVTAAINSTGQKCPAYTGKIGRACNAISANRDYWLGQVAQAGEQAASAKITAVEFDELAKVTTTSSNAYSAIGYSVTAILIIVLVMIIIYLILCYRRKKKMNKKSQYTKLLNQ
ncbi:hypothetical protein PFMALIP_02680 [Plasmodium falciparum MaliPS096_E11]|uniref:Surface antigen n=1 Tax=Plasmodium falciparum MaliPS096_E11 TaxID=1036727 RepID=A0A024WS87_PLAFA|nr:hypothetical protein PFMALIP_02680 [Plasmodium falciparum MaliPS096_E11]